MASVRDSTVISDYRKFILFLSKQLREEDLEQLKHVLCKYISVSKSEKIQHGLDLFKELEHQDVISDGNVSKLIEIFDTIDRRDLASKVKEHIDPVMEASNTDGGNEGARIQTPTPCTKTSCTAVSAFYMQPPEVSQPLYSPCVPEKPSECGSERQERLTSQKLVPGAQPEFTDFLMRDGYVVQILGGRHFATPKGEFVEMKSGTQYTIFVKNSNREVCDLDISIDGNDVGGWRLDGFDELKIERPGNDNHRFTFYRVKQAPDGSGIEKGKQDNGIIECAFTPEARVSVLVKTHDLPEPINIEMPPYATVKEIKHEAQKRLGLKEDPEQILSEGTRILNNYHKLRSCELGCTRVLVLLTTELELCIETSTGQKFPITIHPGRATVRDVMQKIKHHTGVPVEEQKLYHGKTHILDRPGKALPDALVCSREPQLLVNVPEERAGSSEDPVFSKPSIRAAQGSMHPTEVKYTLGAEEAKYLGFRIVQSAVGAQPQGRMDPIQVLEVDESIGAHESAGAKTTEFTAQCGIQAEAQGWTPPIDKTIHPQGLRTRPIQAVTEAQGGGTRSSEAVTVAHGWMPLAEFELQPQMGGTRSSEAVTVEKECCFSPAAGEGKSVTQPDPSWRAGGTTLQGHSSQQFVPVEESIKVDHSRKVVLTLRLVAREDEELGPFPPEECKPLSTLRPPSVPE